MGACKIIAVAGAMALCKAAAGHAQTAYSPWAKFCGRGQDARDVCFTGKDGVNDAGQPAVAAVLIEPRGDARPVFRITVPGPLQLRYGARLTIDAGQPINGPFSTCSSTNDCVADFEATPQLVTSLKMGRTLQIEAINLVAKVVAFKVPLSDMSGDSFRWASEGSPSTDPGAFEERQLKLHAYAQTLPGPLVRGGAFTYSPWAKFCGRGKDPNAKDVCFTGRDGRNAAGAPVVAAALIEPNNDAKKLFRITLPSPLLLQYGTRLSIDGRPPMSGMFFTCLPNGCMADYDATRELVAKLKNGRMLEIQAINLARASVTFPLPLADSAGNSFRQANDGPAMDPRAFEGQQRRLREDLQGRTGVPDR